ncbi:prolyl-tRNA synthetase [Natronospira proteinivora]|uniref:Proline--tRNA ligase n=1 Tax=Natronospira proteinivora TaxID=1807133 RepID=A0ABT1G769_9GAMM|nr:proline--tRNA ligase [Natronospira proteinivora]MCP1726173.1 prolyl-tRNA synthetase [Natronospira proteinivora]
MRVSQFPLFTLKETPADAEIISHQLMLRSGMIRRLASGLYTWLPLGLKVLRRVEQVVREEMNRAGAVELMMPAVQPAELWRESDRWEAYGPELLRLKDRHEREFCFGPTHEEVITDMARNELRSYRQLPVNFYQIQTKFRDEIRPRFGVMRAREFLMKDAYSFHIDQASLAEGYQAMFDAYNRIFERLGLSFRSVDADSGSIGGSVSREFHVLADSGEDEILSADQGDYAANTELATSPGPVIEPQAPAEASKQATPDTETVAAQAKHLNLPLDRIVKSVVVMADEEPAVLFISGDDELNLIKAARALDAEDVRLATGEEALKATGVPKGFIGPIGLPEGLAVRVDHRAATASNFSSGANEKDMHWINLNWDRDVALPATADLRLARAGEPAPEGQGTLRSSRGIEVGHIFQLGTKYSDSMNATVLDESGKDVPMHMGCYGIGVSRIVAAAIEQNHDEQGIIWPQPIAPFQVVIIGIGMDRDEAVREAAESLHDAFQGAGVEALLDDRDARPGVKFADAELIGIPHRLVIGKKSLANGKVEYRGRRDSENRELDYAGIVDTLVGKLGD